MASIYISWDASKESGLMIQKQKTGTENSELMIQKTENYHKQPETTLDVCLMHALYIFQGEKE